jgi:Leucine-rich repeat (LRR) protein
MNDNQLSLTPVALLANKPEFRSLIRLNLSFNSIVELEEEFCKSLPSLETLDLRNNRVKSISPHVKALMSLRALYLDNN